MNKWFIWATRLEYNNNPISIHCLPAFLPPELWLDNQENIDFASLCILALSGERVIEALKFENKYMDILKP